MEQIKLICRLQHHVISRDGDFIPNGSPVQVIGFSDDGKQIEVMSLAHVYADVPRYEHISAGASTGCVNDGLFFYVPFDSVVFDSAPVVQLNK